MRRKHVHTFRGEIDEWDNVAKVGHKVGLGKHNALALTRGARGENEKRELIGVDGVIVVGSVARYML